MSKKDHNLLQPQWTLRAKISSALINRGFRKLSDTAEVLTTLVEVCEEILGNMKHGNTDRRQRPNHQA